MTRSNRAHAERAIADLHQLSTGNVDEVAGRVIAHIEKGIGVHLHGIQTPRIGDVPSYKTLLFVFDDVEGEPAYVIVLFHEDGKMEATVHDADDAVVAPLLRDIETGGDTSSTSDTRH